MTHKNENLINTLKHLIFMINTYSKTIEKHSIQSHYLNKFILLQEDFLKMLHRENFWADFREKLSEFCEMESNLVKCVQWS